MSNATTQVAATVEAATTATRIIGGTVYAGFSLFALSSNTLLLAVFLRGNSQFKSIAFFTVAKQMLACDFISLFVQITLVTPETFAGRQPMRLAIAIFDTFAYNGTLSFSLLLTFNRVCIFLFPELDRIIFQAPAIFISIGGLWAFVLILTAGVEITGCVKDFSTTGFYLYYNCPVNNPSLALLIFTQLRLCVSKIPIVMVVAYLAIFLKIKLAGDCLSRRKKDDGEAGAVRTKREMRFFIQSCIVCTVLELQSLAFGWGSGIVQTGQLMYAANFAIGTLTILINTVHSAVIFSFNSIARKELRTIMGGGAIEKSEPTITVMNSIVTVTGVESRPAKGSVRTTAFSNGIARVRA